MSDPEIIYVAPLNEQHVQSIGISLGLSAALNMLMNERQTFEKLPGFNTAIALVQQIEAMQRAEVAGANFRAAAAAGYDVRTHIVGLIGRGKIYVQPMDLEQLAEFSAETRA